MAKYYVRYNELQSQAASLQNIGKTLNSFEGRLNAIANSMDARDGSMATLMEQVRSSAKTIPVIANKVTTNSAAVSEICATYLSTEKAVNSYITGVSTASVIRILPGGIFINQKVCELNIATLNESSFTNTPALFSVIEGFFKDQSLFSISKDAVGWISKTLNMVKFDKDYTGNFINYLDTYGYSLYEKYGDTIKDAKDYLSIGAFALAVFSSPLNTIKDFADGKITREEATQIIVRDITKETGKEVIKRIGKEVGGVAGSLASFVGPIFEIPDYLQDFADGTITYQDAWAKISTNTAIDTAISVADSALVITKPITVAADYFFESVFDKDFSQVVTEIITGGEMQEHWLGGMRIMGDGIKAGITSVGDSVKSGFNSFCNWLGF